MKVFICGGSNSLSENGWSKHFANLIGDKAEIVNISIGSAPSIMAAYRSILSVRLTQKDILIWEYALNDINHVDMGGYDSNLLLYFCEHIILHCILEKAYFLPLIFTPKNREKEIVIDDYRKELYELFGNYLIQYIDVSVEFRKHLGLKRIPDKYFEKRNHYAQESELVHFIAQRTADLINLGLDLPTRRGPIYVKPEHKLVLHSSFTKGEKRAFHNRVIEIDAWVPTADPLQLASFARSGEILALILITSPHGGVLTINDGKRSLDISATHKERNFPKPMLKVFTLTSATGQAIHYEPDSQIEISWANISENVVADFGFDTNPPLSAKKGRESLIVGLLAVEGATKGFFDRPLTKKSPEKGTANMLRGITSPLQLVQDKQKFILKHADIVSQLRQESPRLLEDLNEKQAIRLVRRILEKVAKHIGNVDEGAIRVSGLGQFFVTHREILFNMPKAAKKKRDQT